MAVRDLGTKRVCTDCGAKFYDLGKMPVECPKCEVSFVPAVLLPPKEQRPVDSKPGGTRWQKPGTAKPAVKPVAANDDADEDKVDDVDDEVAAIADVDLGDDDDDTDTKADDATLLDADSEDEPDVSGIVGTAPADGKEV